MLTRLSVKADNSCLFTSMARLCEAVTDDIPLKLAGRRLREVCAQSPKNDPDPATAALILGHDSIEAYAAWICNDHHWGGEPEVLMLAKHFGVEVCICSCESLSFLRYSPDSGVVASGSAISQGSCTYSNAVVTCSVRFQGIFAYRGKLLTRGVYVQRLSTNGCVRCSSGV